MTHLSIMGTSFKTHQFFSTDNFSHKTKAELLYHDPYPILIKLPSLPLSYIKRPSLNQTSCSLQIPLLPSPFKMPLRIYGGGVFPHHSRQYSAGGGDAIRGASFQQSPNLKEPGNTPLHMDAEETS